jgi:thymidylate synthase (FAD)
MGSDLHVVNAARVSFHKESNWENAEWGHPEFERPNYLSDRDAKLISYLAKHNHWTPFAHCFLSFRIKAPIFVARQLAKHQVGLTWNEVSRRYVDDEPEFFFPDRWRGRPVNAKQGSDGVIELDTRRISPQEMARAALLTYESLLEQGVAPEQARMVLPQNTMTEWIWSGSLAAFARVCKLRLDPHAQVETMEIALMINSLIPQHFEHSWVALLGEPDVHDADA